jgi:hypothetical protein
MPVYAAEHGQIYIKNNGRSPCFIDKIGFADP